VDGNDYAFRTHDTKGKPLPHRNQMCLFLALIEMQKGGSSFTVFDAYGLKFETADGDIVYPVPAAVAVAENVVEMSQEEAELSGFSLGD